MFVWKKVGERRKGKGIGYWHGKGKRKRVGGLSSSFQKVRLNPTADDEAIVESANCNLKRWFEFGESKLYTSQRGGQKAE